MKTPTTLKLVGTLAVLGGTFSTAIGVESCNATALFGGLVPFAAGLLVFVAGRILEGARS